VIGLTLDSVASIVHNLKRHEIDFNEPIPQFEECNLGRIASSLKTPFLRPLTSSDKKERFCFRAAHLFCLLIENHCFPNGNKRIAVTSLVTFGDINGFDFSRLKEFELYALAIAVTFLGKYELFNAAISEVKQKLLDNVERKRGRQVPEGELKKLKKEFKEFMISRS